MNKQEAKEILRAVIDELRKESYSSLVADYLPDWVQRTVVGESGVSYYLEIRAIWDGAEGGNVRVLATIDDGGWRAWSPLSSDFIIAEDGSFVGE